MHENIGLEIREWLDLRERLRGISFILGTGSDGLVEEAMRISTPPIWNIYDIPAFEWLNYFQLWIVSISLSR